MPDISLSEDFIKRLKVKVYLKEPDARLYLCGEPKQHNQDGSSYFVIPAHQRQYIKDIMPHYIVGEEYLEEKKNTPVEELELNLKMAGDKFSDELGIKRGPGRPPKSME